MTLLARTFVRELTLSATRLGRALTRSSAAQYAEQRAQIERTGFGGML